MPAIIALGSNLGDSVRILDEAVKRLQDFSPQPVVCSSFWQTSPVDCPPGSAAFVNAVVALVPRPEETPESLLHQLLVLEKEFGRMPKKQWNEARPLDLDLIAFDGEVRTSPELTLPHPRAHLRRFVLQPLCEIAPVLVLPGQGRPVGQLLAELDSTETVAKVPRP